MKNINYNKVKLYFFNSPRRPPQPTNFYTSKKHFVKKFTLQLFCLNSARIKDYEIMGSDILFVCLYI